MSDTDDTREPRPQADTDDAAPRGNPDLHGAAKDVEEKRASGDPETTGA